MPVAASPSNVPIANANPSATPTQSAADQEGSTVLPAPEVQVNGKPTAPDTPLSTPRSPTVNLTSETDTSAWGAHFWVTLADPAVSSLQFHI